MAFHSKKPSTITMQRGLPEGWQGCHGLAFGIDRLAPALRVCVRMWDQAPAVGSGPSAIQWVQRDLAGLVVAPDNQQVPAWAQRSIAADNCARGCLEAWGRRDSGPVAFVTHRQAFPLARRKMSGGVYNAGWRWLGPWVAEEPGLLEWWAD
jgi:hypothetical protein